MNRMGLVYLPGAEKGPFPSQATSCPWRALCVSTLTPLLTESDTSKIITFGANLVLTES